MRFLLWSRENGRIIARLYGDDPHRLADWKETIAPRVVLGPLEIQDDTLTLAQVCRMHPAPRA